MEHVATVQDQINAEVVALIRQQAGTDPQEIVLMGKTCTVLPEVFYATPLHHPLEYISYSPLKIVAEELARRGPATALEVLEIGPGVGHFVIGAASLGPQITVTAVDISPTAVDNVHLNAARHGVAERVHCAVGDVYNAPVTAGKQFDVIFWDPPFTRGATDLATHTTLERAVWDPNYAGLTPYIARAREFLKPAGRLLLTWNDFFGDAARLQALATTHGWHLHTYGMAHFPLGPQYLTFLSYELIPQENTHTCATCGTVARH